MSLWDQHVDFLAEEVAHLALEDISEISGLLSLMRKAYGEAFSAVVTKYLIITGQLELENYTGLDLSLSIEDQLSQDCLYSRALKAYAEIFLDPNKSTQYDEIALTDAHNFFRSFIEKKGGESPVLSGRFEIQRFSREEIDRWLNLRGIASKYKFALENNATVISHDRAPASVQPIDTSILVTPNDLLAAFSQWGLKKQWFNEPGNHPWLYSARKVIGRGGNKPIPPLYCPYEVMLGLRTVSRAARDRFSEKKGWEILSKHFRAAFERYKACMPDLDQSKKDF